jgi:predicted outer membrane protein
MPYTVFMKKKLALIIILVALAFGALAQTPALNDAQIASVLVDANLVDIKAGKLAHRKIRKSSFLPSVWLRITGSPMSPQPS